MKPQTYDIHHLPPPEKRKVLWHLTYRGKDSGWVYQTAVGWLTILGGMSTWATWQDYLLRRASDIKITGPFDPADIPEGQKLLEGGNTRQER